MQKEVPEQPAGVPVQGQHPADPVRASLAGQPAQPYQVENRRIIMEKGPH